MRKPYARPMVTALPDVRLAEPRVRPAVVALAGALSGAYLRLGLGYRSVELRGAGTLVDEFADALAGRSRLVLAFRHPYGDEAQLMSWVFLRGVAREARRLGVALARRPLAVFVHGYEVPRWSGPLVRWILPRMGALPVHHAKMDSSGMARIRAAIENGPWPLALAPEGQVSYASERVPRLEAGTARLALGAVDALRGRGLELPVRILPLSVHHRYGPGARRSLERLVARIERFAGVKGSAAAPGGGLPGRLFAARDALLAEAERSYGLPVAEGAAAGDRLSSLIERALADGERILGLPHGRGDPIERVYRIRQAGWDRIYLPAPESPRRRPPVGRALLDRRAGEAWYAMRHMELVDFAWYFAAEPPDGELAAAPFHALAEYAQNLWDFGNRLAGGAISGRLAVRPRRAIVMAAPAIEVGKNAAGVARSTGVDRRAATAALTAELESAYRRCIEEIRRED